MKFWRMTGLIAASPVDTILDKDNCTLAELLDEDDIIYECRGQNTRLINFLRGRAQVKQLLCYIVEEAPNDAEQKQIFKFPFVACEIFTCEIDAMRNAVVEDEEMMDMLFSFLKPDHPRNTLLAGYFSKVVICLLLRKTSTLITYVQSHQEILRQLVDLIGITSIMEVLLRLIGASDDMYSNYDEMEWLKDTDVLELIVDKFRSSDSPGVHANAAEVLCAIIRYAPPGLSSEICSSSFMGRLLLHALEGSRPKSVLVHALSVCISLLDPKRLVSASYNLFRSQRTKGSLVAAHPETVNEMLESLGDLLKLLDVSSAAIFFPTTYGYLKPPFGKHRLKIVEFISVLLTIGSEAAEKELVRHGAIKHSLNMFFDYPYNNFLHRAVVNMIALCLESKSTLLIEHLLRDCDIVGKILGAEKQPLLLADCSKPTIATRGRSPPRIGNFGHMTCIANKLIQMSNSNNVIRTHLQENKDWAVWHANVLLKRNAIDNVSRWSCGRPNALQDQFRDSDNDSRGTDYEVMGLASNLRQAYSIEGGEEDHGSMEQDDEEVSIDKESAESTSSCGLPENPDNISLFTNSSWFSYEEDRVGKDHSTSSSDQRLEAIDSDGNDNLNNSRMSSEPTDLQSSVSENGDEEPTYLQNPSEVLSDPSPLASSIAHELKANEDHLTIQGNADVNTLPEPETGIQGEVDLDSKPSTEEDADILATPVSEDSKHEKNSAANEDG